MNDKISIIVPVFNAVDFIHSCVNCIKAQTYQDYEVILVDDGSTDDSIRVLNFYCTQDHRFQLYRQEHRGASAARNVGIKYATGCYICFIDADDQIAPSYLNDLYQAIGVADSSMCGFKKIDLLSHIDCEVVPQKQIENLEENLLGFYNANSTDWQRYLWNRMFKRTIIIEKNLRFRENIFYKEDGLFVVQYLCASNGLVGCAGKALYFYYRSINGAMGKTWHNFDEKIITNLEAHRLIIEEIRHKGVSDAVLSKSFDQAKYACNWIFQMINQTKSFKWSSFMRIEKIMISILGLREYLFWRTSQLIKLLK